MEQGGESWVSYNCYTPDIIGANKCKITTSIEEKNGTNQCKKSFGNPKSTIGHHRFDQARRKNSLKINFSHPLGPDSD